MSLPKQAVSTKVMSSFSSKPIPEQDLNPSTHPHLTPTPRKEIVKLCTSPESSNVDSDSSSPMPNYYCAENPDELAPRLTHKCSTKCHNFLPFYWNSKERVFPNMQVCCNFVKTHEVLKNKESLKMFHFTPQLAKSTLT